MQNKERINEALLILEIISTNFPSRQLQITHSKKIKPGQISAPKKVSLCI